MDEVFKIAFDVMRKRVTEGPRPDPRSNSVPPIPFASSSVEPQLKKLPPSQDRLQITEKMKRFRDMKDVRARETKKCLEENEELLNLIENGESYSKNGCLQHFYYSLKQLNSHNLMAERRMRELVFEVMGEYGKCALRSKRRYAYLRCSYRINKAMTIFRMRWHFFMERFIYEAIKQHHVDNVNAFEKHLRINSNQYSIICPQKSKEEYSEVKNVVTSILSSTPSSDIMVSMVVKYVTPEIKGRPQLQVQGQTTPRGQRRASRLQAPVIATSIHDLHKVVHEARRYVNMGQVGSSNRPTSSKRTPRSNGSRDDCVNVSSLTLLSASSIEWMRPCSYHPISSDTLASIFSYVPNKSGNGNRSSSAMTNAMETRNQFDSFCNRFISQHAAKCNSHHVYFCLEERSGIVCNLPNNGDETKGVSALQFMRYLQV